MNLTILDCAAGLFRPRRIDHRNRVIDTPDVGDRMVLSPNWPNRLVHSAFPIRCRGHHMYVRVSGNGREATVVAR